MQRVPGSSGLIEWSTPANFNMKYTCLWIAIACVAVGCTQITKNADGTVSYKNGLFNKTFSELEYTEIRTTNGVATTKVRVKGYESDGTKLVEATARGVAQGLAPKP